MKPAGEETLEKAFIAGWMKVEVIFQVILIHDFEFNIKNKCYLKSMKVVS